MSNSVDTIDTIIEESPRRLNVLLLILTVFSIVVPIGIVGICVGNSEKRKTGRTLGRDLSILGTVIGTAFLCAICTFFVLEFCAPGTYTSKAFEVAYNRFDWTQEETMPYFQTLVSRDNTVILSLDIEQALCADELVDISDETEWDFSSSADRQDNYDLFLVNYFNFLGQERILESASDLMPVEGNSDLYYAYVDLTEESDGKTNGTLQYYLLSVSMNSSLTFQVSLYDTEKSIAEVDALVEDVLSTMTIKAE